MVNLNLKLWKVNDNNNWLLLWWPDNDLKSAANDISNAASQVLSPVNTLVENTIDTVRHPIDNILNFKKKNGSYTKLLKFVPATIALAATQALDKPFATVEKAMEYVVNNNLERAWEFSKNITTRFLSNIITSNWETWSNTLKWLWGFIEWAWDLVTSAVKLPFWLTHKLIKAPRNIKWYGTEAAANWSTNWMKELQVSGSNYLNLNLVNKNTENPEISNNTDFQSEKKVA